ncbi:KUP/HAK/KT family potassium transporter [bacterium]|nr:KUP/HAK/KT family potassium transporter [bacterium]
MSAEDVPAEEATAPSSHVHGSLGVLTLGALGVVYGDIGTSPLYSLAECFGAHGVSVADRANLYGILSLFFWSLTLVVTFKYVTVLMRAENHGEGGIMALLSLVPEPRRRIQGKRIGWVTLLVLFGAALLFGDGVITPAISVLSAVEGLKLVSPALGDWVVTITSVILILLFAIQRGGTGPIGKLFGPIMVTWFVVLGGLGLYHLAQAPQVLAAISPHYGLFFFVQHKGHGFALLGSVVLCVTGGEALYADMGHFGRTPIRLAWGGLVFPALLLNYFGQGALLLQDPSLASAPFFSMVSSPHARIALVLLATAATIIASQALISAVFSLTHQAIRMGYFPRVSVRHTSSEVEGQIYLASMNWCLAAACVLLVLVLRESTRLAAAYGLAVSGTMAITSVILFQVTRHNWKWPAWKCWSLLLLFLSFDLPFLGATCLKFLEGGWIPLLMGGVVFAIMVLWTTGRSLLRQAHQNRTVTDAVWLERVATQAPLRTAGLGVYLASSTELTPPALMTQMERIRAIPEEIMLVTITSENVPYIEDSQRLQVRKVADNYYRVTLRYGFMEIPEVPPGISAAAAQLPLRGSLQQATYYVGRESFEATDANQLVGWQETLYAVLARNSSDMTRYYALPTEQVVEIGTRLDL